MPRVRDCLHEYMDCLGVEVPEDVDLGNFREWLEENYELSLTSQNVQQAIDINFSFGSQTSPKPPLEFAKEMLADDLKRVRYFHASKESSRYDRRRVPDKLEIRVEHMRVDESPRRFWGFIRFSDGALLDFGGDNNNVPQFGDGSVSYLHRDIGSKILLERYVHWLVNLPPTEPSRSPAPPPPILRMRPERPMRLTPTHLEFEEAVVSGSHVTYLTLPGEAPDEHQ